MPNPNIQIDDEVREMTDDEVAALIASGWTLEPQEDAPEVPASDDAGAPSTDAG